MGKCSHGKKGPTEKKFAYMRNVLPSVTSKGKNDTTETGTSTASRRTRQYKRRQRTVMRKQSTAAKGRERIPRKAIDRSSRKVDISVGDIKQSERKVHVGFI